MSLDHSKLENLKAKGNGYLARCPACAENSEDRQGNHLSIDPLGRFACVVFQKPSGEEHRSRIFELAGIMESKREDSVWKPVPVAPSNAPSPSLHHPRLGEPAQSWTYKSQSGETAGLVARYNTKTGKEFRPQTWCRDQHGQTAWRWQAQAEPRMLYGLPFQEHRVVITEGEKAADAVIQAGFCGTTWQGGASAVGKSDLSPLHGKNCCIWPDNDEQGKRAARELVARLSGIAAQIRIVQIPEGKPPKWDAADSDRDEIRLLVSEAVLANHEDVAPLTSDASQLENTIDRLKAFKFRSSDSLGDVAETVDFVENLLTEGGASLIYGPSNCGKSFWIVDLAVAVATGSPFRDEMEVEQGAVIYVALEGAQGATNRIHALKKEGRLKAGTPFYLIFEAVSLLETGHSARLAKTIGLVAADASLPVKLVILDTMARAMAGGDENSGQDMTAAIQTIDAIRASTGAHVSIVHHCGKDEAKGARGHSSLRAAMDTELEVSRPQGHSISTVRVTKQRDLPAREPMPFSLHSVELGKNRRGATITSCIVRHEDEMMAQATRKAGRKSACKSDELLSLLPANSTADWKRKSFTEFGISETTFHRERRKLEGNGAVKTEEGTWVLEGVPK